MAGIVLDGENRGSDVIPLTSYQTPFWDYMGAKSDEALHANSISRAIFDDKLSAAKADVSVEGDFDPVTGMSIGGAPEITVTPKAKLDATTARAKIKAAGVALTVPDDGISDEALNLLINNKQDKVKQQAVVNGSPTGLRSVFGLGAQLAVSLLDPLNVAAAYVPVISGARYTSLLAGASSAVERSAIRAGVGAAEGAVGTSLFEPLNYLSSKQEQNDYSMTDTLTNIAFGSLFGGGLHVVGGGVGDFLHPGKWDKPPDILPVFHDLAEGKVSREALDTMLREQPRYVSELTTAPIPDLPFPRRSEENLSARALAEVSPELRAELIAESGGRLSPGERPYPIEQATAEIAPLQAKLSELKEPQAIKDLQLKITNLDEPKAFKDLAKEFQGERMSRKEAEAAARKEIITQRNDLSAKLEAVQQQIEAQRAETQTKLDNIQEAVDKNAVASRAESDIALLDRGEVPERFKDRVQQHEAAMRTRESIVAAFDPPPESSARYAIANASGDTRQGMLQAAVGQLIGGKHVEVEPVFRTAAGTMAADELRAVAQKQASPAGTRLTDQSLSAAASDRLKTLSAEYSVPEARSFKDSNVAMAQKEAQTAMDYVNKMRESLKDSGIDVMTMDEDVRSMMEQSQRSQAMADAARAAGLCGMRS